jgi:hypothetical protein
MVRSLGNPKITNSMIFFKYPFVGEISGHAQYKAGDHSRRNFDSFNQISHFSFKVYAILPRKLMKNLTSSFFQSAILYGSRFP